MIVLNVTMELVVRPNIMTLKQAKMVKIAFNRYFPFVKGQEEAMGDEILRIGQLLYMYLNSKDCSKRLRRMGTIEEPSLYSAKALEETFEVFGIYIPEDREERLALERELLEEGIKANADLVFHTSGFLYSGFSESRFVPSLGKDFCEFHFKYNSIQMFKRALMSDRFLSPEDSIRLFLDQTANRAQPVLPAQPITFGYDRALQQAPDPRPPVQAEVPPAVVQEAPVSLTAQAFVERFNGMPLVDDTILMDGEHLVNPLILLTSISHPYRLETLMTILGLGNQQERAPDPMSRVHFELADVIPAFSPRNILLVAACNARANNPNFGRTPESTKLLNDAFGQGENALTADSIAAAEHYLEHFFNQTLALYNPTNRVIAPERHVVRDDYLREQMAVVAGILDRQDPTIRDNFVRPRPRV